MSEKQTGRSLLGSCECVDPSFPSVTPIAGKNQKAAFQRLVPDSGGIVHRQRTSKPHNWGPCDAFVCVWRVEATPTSGRGDPFSLTLFCFQALYGFCVFFHPLQISRASERSMEAWMTKLVIGKSTKMKAKATMTITHGCQLQGGRCWEQPCIQH